MNSVLRDREAAAQTDEVQRVLEAVADAIVIVDARGAIKGMNAAAEHLFSRAAADVLGRPYTVLLPDLEGMKVRSLLAKSQAGRGLDAQAQDAEGQSIPIHMTISAVADAANRHFIFAIRDFRAIRAAQQRLLASQRLAAIGETMTALAHESRNALQRIQSCLTLLQLKADSEEIEELVRDMQDAQDQLQRLYEEVNNFAAPLQLRPRLTALGPLLERTWRQLHLQWKAKQLRLAKEDAAADVRVRVDSARIGQVFRNLFENAIDASRESRPVEVRLAERALEGRDGVEVTIRDEGKGIPDEVRGRVFDLLFTTKESGTGMGLALAKRVVEEHEGGLRIVESHSGGTTVAVWLPRGDD